MKWTMNLLQLKWLMPSLCPLYDVSLCEPRDVSEFFTWSKFTVHFISTVLDQERQVITETLGRSHCVCHICFINLSPKYHSRMSKTFCGTWMWGKMKWKALFKDWQQMSNNKLNFDFNWCFWLKYIFFSCSCHSTCKSLRIWHLAGWSRDNFQSTGNFNLLILLNFRRIFLKD